MTTMAGCPICATPRPSDRAGNVPWCCSVACYRSFHGIEPATSSCHDVVPIDCQPRRPSTVYECDGCNARAVGEQGCGDCGTIMRRVGIGGCCPSCDEPVAAAELLGREVTA